MCFYSYVQGVYAICIIGEIVIFLWQKMWNNQYISRCLLVWELYISFGIILAVAVKNRNFICGTSLFHVFFGQNYIFLWISPLNFLFMCTLHQPVTQKSAFMCLLWLKWKHLVLSINHYFLVKFNHLLQWL